MPNPLTFYFDMVDTSAFEKAQRDGWIGQYDAPFAPLLAPWTIGGPVLAIGWLPPSYREGILLACIALSFALYGGVAVFYDRRVQQHRRESGTGNDS